MTKIEKTINFKIMKQKRNKIEKQNLCATKKFER